MSSVFLKEMAILSNKLDRYYQVLLLKCEICGPILRGAKKDKYPECKKHKEV